MTRTEIITIGDELIRGSKDNTNASWLAKTLTEAGGKVEKITTVGDTPSKISREIERTIEEGTNLVAITGGLGPTPDDVTLEAVSNALGSELELDEKAVQMVEENYKRMKEKEIVKKEGLTPAREKMAEIPANAEPIENPEGGAPAVLAEKEGTKILCLPGVPREMKAIVKKNLKKIGLHKPEKLEKSRNLSVEGIEESSLAPVYDELEEEFPEVEIRSYPRGLGAKGEITIKISGENEQILSEAEKFLSEKIGEMDEVRIDPIY